MFRQVSKVALVVLVAVSSVAVATAAGPKEAGSKTKSPPTVAANTKQIANSIGMKLTLVPSGEFLMGSGEPAEETAAFFNKTYGGNLKADNFKNEHPQHRVRITKPFYLGAYLVTRGQFRQFVADTGFRTRRGEGREAWGPWFGHRQEGLRLHREVFLAGPGVRADR